MKRDDQYRFSAILTLVGYIGIAVCCLYLIIMAQL
jgi:hypothetical protein